MMKKYSFYMFLITFFCFNGVYCIEKQTPLNFKTFGNPNGQPILLVPGIGFAGQTFYNYAKNTVFNEKDHHIGIFDFEDISPLDDRSITEKYVNFGQKPDMDRLKKAIKEFCKIQNKKIILYGISRGGTTIIKLLGNLKYYTKKEQKLITQNVSLAILESPFAHCVDTGVYQLSQTRTFKNRLYSWLLSLPRITLGCFMKLMFPKYKVFGPQAEFSAKNVPPHIPIHIIHSKTDEKCPYEGSEKLNQILTGNLGRINTSLFTIENGNHTEILHGQYTNELKNHIAKLFKIIKKRPSTS